MPANTIELEFGDGQYVFALPLVQINELQRKTGIGIGGLYGRTLKGVSMVGGHLVLIAGQAEFYALDVIETIRHGLIGGGKGVVNGEPVEVTPVLANKLIDAYVLGQPMVSAWNTAISVLHACIMGYDAPKKAKPPPKGAARKRKKKTDA